MADSPRLLRSRLYDLQLLPPFPASAREILRVFADDAADLDTVEQVISLEPNLAARIIGLANSAYYGQQGRILNLRSAILITLGLDTVKGLALAMAMAQSFRLRSGTHFSTEHFWLRAVTVAKAAGLLVEVMPDVLEPLESADLPAGSQSGGASKQAYLAGLFHQIGLAALAYLDLAALDRALVENDGAGPDLSVRETREFGMTHQQAGFTLGKAWQLPKPVLQVIAHYHQADYGGPYRRWVGVVHLASRFALWLDSPEALSAGAGNAFLPLDRLGLQARDLPMLLDRLRQEREPLRLMAQAINRG